MHALGGGKHRTISEGLLERKRTTYSLNRTRSQDVYKSIEHRSVYVTDFNTHPPLTGGVICSEKNRIASGAPPGTAEAASHPGKTLGPSPTRPRPTCGPKMSPGSIDAFGNSLGATCFEATRRGPVGGDGANGISVGRANS